MPENTTSIGCFAFYQNNENVNFLMPDSVVSIGSFAFAVNNNLKSITMGSCLKYIGKQAFVSCNSLQEIKFNGTKEQWNNVYKDAEWNLNVPAKKVTCLDGEVIL